MDGIIIGRGRCRGRRIIDIPDIRRLLPAGRGAPVPVDPSPGAALVANPPTGRGFTAPEENRPVSFGRGSMLLTSVAAERARARPLPIDYMPREEYLGLESLSLSEQSKSTPRTAKDDLVLELSKLTDTDKGCLIRITLNYFKHELDVEFYVEQVLKCVMVSQKMVLKFTMCLKLLQHLRSFGEDIKTKTLSKLQADFSKMPDIIDIQEFNEEELFRLNNLCSLIGQVYFRFRPRLDAPERYHVLANPVATCLTHLLHARGTLALSTLVNLINVNSEALFEDSRAKMEELCTAAHKALVCNGVSAEERVWILCAIDLLTSGAQAHRLPHNITAFYRQCIGAHWWAKVITEFPTQLLADIPADVTPRELDDFFNLDVDKYNAHKFVDK